MKRSPSITSKLPALATLAVIVAIWLGASEGGLVPEFMLPSPAQVWDALVTDFPTLMANAAVTLQEAGAGPRCPPPSCGAAAGLFAAYS